MTDRRDDDLLRFALADEADRARPHPGAWSTIESKVRGGSEHGRWLLGAAATALIALAVVALALAFWDRPDELTVAVDPAPTPPLESTSTEPATGTRSREQVTPLVLNASGVSGAATQVVNALLVLNYVPRAPEDAPERAEVTTIYYEDGWRAEALRLAGDLDIDVPQSIIEPLPSPAPMGVVTGPATLVVVLGHDQVIAAARRPG